MTAAVSFVAHDPPRERRARRHEAFLNRLERIGTSRDPAWGATASGLRLLRSLDSWVEMGPRLIRGDPYVLRIREAAAALAEEWADLRVALISAFDALAFSETPPSVRLSTATIRAGWMRAVLALADAADAYERHGYPDLTLDVYASVLKHLPPADEKRATKRAGVVDQLANRARATVQRLTPQEA